MKQILITPTIKTFAKQYSDELFADKTDAFVQPEQGLKNLITDLQEVNDGLANRERYIKYLEEIINDYAKLKSLLPSDFSTYKTKYDGIILDSSLSVKIKYRDAKLPSLKTERDKLNTSIGVFYQLIVDRMHYKDTRTYLGPYMKKIGLNTCVYCNNTKAAVSEERMEVYYPFDHNKPKSEYPFLCICFFNLYPCCDNCNRHKLNDDKKGFQVYVEAEPLYDPFAFVINRNSIVEGDPESVVIDFKARRVVDKTYAMDYDNWFRIKDLYNTPDEKRNSFQLIKLIDKHRASYPNALEASVSIPLNRKDLFTDVLGVKDDDIIFTDINKKLKLDTAKDMGLL